MTSHTAWPGSTGNAATGQARRTTIRVLLHATDPLVLAGLHAMLRSAAGIELVTDAGTADVTVAVADAGLHNVFTPGTIRLVLIADEHQAELWTEIGRGLIVLVPREEASTRARLLRAVTDANEEPGRLPVEQLDAVLQDLRHLQERRPDRHNLSPRETEVIRLLADGLDTSEIAVRLIYSERTVKNVLHSLLSRLNLRNRAHAVAFALRHDLI